MNITIQKQPTTTKYIRVRKTNRHPETEVERHANRQETSREWARRRYHEIRTNKWQEALEYMLTLKGEIPELASQLADKYNISKVKY